MRFRTVRFLFFLFVGVLIALSVSAYDKGVVDSLVNKRYLFKQDMPKVDSLLRVIEKTSGKKNVDYINLASKRLRSTVGKGYDSVEYLIKDIINLAPLDLPYDYDLVKRALTNCGSYYYNKDKNRWREVCASKWNAEKSHSKDSLNLNDLHTYYFNFISLKQYHVADSILADYEIFAKKKFGDVSEYHLDAIKRRVDVLKTYTHYAPADKKAICFKLLNQKYNDQIELEKNLYGADTNRYQQLLSNYINTSNVYLPKVSKADSLKYITSIQNRLQEWYSLKGDTLDIKGNNGSNKSTLQTWISNRYENKKTDEASAAAKLYIEKMKDGYGKYSEEYYMALTFLHSNSNGEIEGDDKNALLDEMMAVAENVYGKEHIYYQSPLYEKMSNASIKGDLGSAVEIISGEEDAWNGNKSQLAQIYSSYGFPEKARELYKKSIDESLGNILAGDTNQLNIMYLQADVLCYLQDCYSYKDLTDAEKFSSELITNLSFNKDLQSDMFLNSGYYMSLLRNPRTADFIKTQLERYPYLLENSYQNKTLVMLSSLYALLGDNDSARECVEKVKSIPDLKHKNLEYLLLNEFISALKEDQDSQLHFNNLSLKEIAGDINTTEGVALLYRNALMQMKLGNYQAAINSLEHAKKILDDEGLENIKGLLDTNDFSDAVSLFTLFNQTGIALQIDYTKNLADLRYLTGHKKDAKTMITPVISNSWNRLTEVMDLFITGGRSSELQQLTDETTSLLNLWASRYPADKEISSMAYNTLLLTKQLELNTLNNIRNIALSSGDKTLVEKYQELININNLQDKAIAAGKPDPKLAMQSAALTKQLAIDAKQKGEISKNLILDWTELQKKIEPEDCVVEFANYTNSDGSKSYIALFFTKRSNLKVIPLFNEKDLNLSSIDYLDPLAYNMIWKPILDKTGSVKNIYFSPSGILHLVGLEHLSNGEATISDIYNMHRLSSTRELLSKNNTNLNSAVLYGGVNYDADVNTASAEINDSNHADAEFRDMLTEFMRGTKRGVAYLPGTKQEVDDINSLIRSITKTECREGMEASEISLKELSGNSPSILHIATHGFFMTDKAASKVSNSMFGSLGSDALSHGDKSMIRSGILLAGANNTLLGKQNRAGDNDGVLTAKEVSTLDLANTGLVVLSACNSAVGDISGEGVYGIQRGFKMAGASSILVTLWEVDDRATQILMTRFYKNLISGSTPNQSLKEASVYLRNYTENGAKPYTNPKYWAAFILLDGLN